MSRVEPGEGDEHRPLNLSGLVRSVVASGRVVKRYPAGLARELSKAVAIASIGERRGFTVPAVLGHDPTAQTITYQWLNDLTPLRDLYLAYMRRRDLAGRCETAVRLAGTTLGALHRELSTVDTVRWEAPPAFIREARRRLGAMWQIRLDASPQAALHCDYGFGNIHLAGGTRPRIALLDPSPNYYLTFDPLTSGSVYLDVGTLVGCLWGLVPLHHYWRLDRSRLAPLEDAFRTGYECAVGWRLDRELIDGVTSAVVATYLTRRLRSSWLATGATRIIGWTARRGTRVEPR